MPVIPGDPMSPMAGPELVVNPPPLEPEPSGLLVTLQIMEDSSDRFIGGIRHRPENFAPILGLDPCANVVIPATYTSLPPRVGRAFVAQVEEECGSFGWEAADYQGRATRGLLARESVFVEAELERAVTVPENPHLAAPGTYVPTGISVAASTGNQFVLHDGSGGFRQYMEGWTVSGEYWNAGSGPVTITQVLSDTDVVVSKAPSKVVNLTTAAASAAITAAAGPTGALLDTVNDPGANLSGNTHIPVGETLATVTSTTAGTLSSATGVTAGAGVATTISPTRALAGLTVTFADPGFVQLAGGQAVSPQLAMAYLNQAIADAGLGMGLIHLPSYVGERVLSARAVIGGQGPNTRYYSVNGNPVIIGNGYSGVGPDTPQTGGSPAGLAPSANPVQWAYATDLMQVVRAPNVRVYPDNFEAALDRTANLVAYRASRPFAINWSGLLRAAVKVAVTS